ncbi:cilia- and flagella-associated protein 221-like [Diadema antillarum]|uniref:cilia- and flagella-associated protein 221-like n=1 Tax=Diadema antillarum TaxID=105358 RepID=UPI003A877D6B
MAVERPLSQLNADPLSPLRSKSGLNGTSIVLHESLVAPEKKKTVPNHLLDTKIYHKLSFNDVLQVEPAIVHFPGFEPGKVHRQVLNIINVSSECQQMHIIPPATHYFKAWYKKRDRLVPGLSMEVTVEFRPDEWRYFYDCIRIHCQSTEHLVIPVHAYPVMSTDFPEIVKFPATPVSQRQTKVIPLKCNIPVDFEFQLKFVQPHPAISITPTTGVVPGNGQVDLTATYAPSDFSTAVVKMQLIISQFNTKPLDCTLIGYSSPGLAVPQKSKTNQSDVGTEGPLSPANTAMNASQLDPHSISPISMARRKRQYKGTVKKVTIKEKTKPANEGVEKEGVRFPQNLDVQHSVNAVLIQTPGKLTVKELREAVMSKSGSAQALNPRQLKEAIFDREVREDVLAERKNQLRWQVHLGRDQMTPDERLEITEARKEAVKDYHFKRGDPLAEMEFSRGCTTCSQRRTYRRAEEVPAQTAQFDAYRNDPWALKHRAIGRFQQAVLKVILRQRADDKWSLLRKLVDDYRSGNAGKVDIVTFGGDGEAKYDYLPLHISPESVLTYGFPSYIAPDYKDDMAPDALGIVPSKPTDIVVKRKVPYLGLKVPQQYHLMGYRPHNVLDAAVGYVAPKLVRTLRTGAEDELITMPVPEAAWPDKDQPGVDRLEGIHREDGDDDGEVRDEEDEEEVIELVSGEDRKAVPLVPPAALFKSVDYPSLHIFNPAPGLQVFLPPLPYSEVDPDFHLCPLPRYTHSDPRNKHGATLKKYLDREDVIKGVMAWKKFPSQGLVSLANTPTLTNVWVPRWTDTFGTDLLPDTVPPLLDGLPEADRENIVLSDDSDGEEPETKEVIPEVTLTPSMVNAEFPLINAPQTPEVQQTPDSEEFPFGTKLPTHNNPVSSNGPVPREKRESELEVFLKKRYNRLGEKIQERVSHVNTLTNDPDLILH